MPSHGWFGIEGLNRRSPIMRSQYGMPLNTSSPLSRYPRSFPDVVSMIFVYSTFCQLGNDVSIYMMMLRK
jgi:hypothetical protein